MTMPMPMPMPPPPSRARSVLGRAAGRAAFVLAAAAAAGCGPADECAPVGARCDGNVAETCSFQWDNELDGHTTLSREDCGDRHCRTPPPGAPGRAFCALDRAPDPRSPAELRDRAEVLGCVDGALTTWRYGYRTAAAACPADRTCVDAQAPGFDPACVGTAFCSPLPAADPLCDGHRGTACADEATIVYCACNYREDAHACASPGPRCVEEPAPGTDLVVGVCRPD